MNDSNCPNMDHLTAYLRGLLPEVEAEETETHLAACEKCEKSLETADSLEHTVAEAYRRYEAGENRFLEETEFRRAVAAAEELAGETPPHEPDGISDSAEDHRANPGAVALEVPGPAAPAPAVEFPTFGEYQLLQCLGSGGMGKVYKARHLRLNKIVAVKMLHERRAGEASTAARFAREMMAVGALDHPNLVRAMDAREVDGRPLLVMEFVDGIDLARVVGRAGPLPIADACEIVRQAALGLQSAHDHGLVHRDIKPSNLMLTVVPSPGATGRRAAVGEVGRGAGGEDGEGGEGVVKVLDLGLAMFQAPAPTEAEVTDSGQALGTAEFTSPEQISDSHKVDARSDLYSLGCTFYKLLTGQAPFEGPHYPTRVEKLSAHLLKAVPDVRTLRPEVPDELAELLRRMTMKSPSARLASMADVAREAASFCAGHDLPRLLKRAVEGCGQTDATSRTDEFQSSALVSTGASARAERAAKVEIAEDPRRRRRKWPRALALAGAAFAAVALGAVITITTDGGTLEIKTLDKDVRVVVSQNGREVKIVDALSGHQVKLRSGEYELKIADDRDGLTLSADSFSLRRWDRVIVQVSRRPVQPPLAPPSPSDWRGPALKDFFKGVPGRWIPVLTSEDDLRKLVTGSGTNSVDRLLAAGAIEYHEGVLKIPVQERQILFRIPSLKSSVQGIRAKVTMIWGSTQLVVREGAEGSYLAFFHPIGFMGIGAAIQGRYVGDLKKVACRRHDRHEELDQFVPIGLAALGDRIVCEIDGNAAIELRDKRVTFGLPAFGVGNGGPVFFKDVEVFVPDEDPAPKP